MVEEGGKSGVGKKARRALAGERWQVSDGRSTALEPSGGRSRERAGRRLCLSALSGAHQAERTDESVGFLRREPRNHPHVEEHDPVRPARLGVEQDVAWVQIRMHEVVEQQHLEVEVLAPRDDKVGAMAVERRELGLGAERLVGRVLGNQHAGFEALHEHRL